MPFRFTCVKRFRRSHTGANTWWRRSESCRSESGRRELARYCLAIQQNAGTGIPGRTRVGRVITLDGSLDQASRWSRTRRFSVLPRVWSQDDVRFGISFDRSSRQTDSAGPGTCPSGIRQHGLHADSGEQKPVAGPQLPGAGERQSCSRVSRSRGRVVPARPTPPMVAGRGLVPCGTCVPIPPVVAAPVSCSDTACTTGEVAHGPGGPWSVSTAGGPRREAATICAPAPH